jgi:hypothetical protein
MSAISGNSTGTRFMRGTQSYEGVRAWIEEHIEDEAQHAAAVSKYDDVMIRARNTPELYPPR